MYEYTFDETNAGDARYSRPECGLFLGALTLLKEKLDGWNKVQQNTGQPRRPTSKKLPISTA